MTQWEQLISRIQQEVAYQLRNNNGAKDQGIVRVNLVVLMDIKEPLIWELESKKIEPSSRAKALLGLINSESIDIT